MFSITFPSVISSPPPPQIMDLEEEKNEEELAYFYDFNEQLEKARLLAEARRESMLKKELVATAPSSSSSFGTFSPSAPLPAAVQQQERFTASFAWAPAPPPSQKVEEDINDAMDLDDDPTFW